MSKRNIKSSPTSRRPQPDIHLTTSKPTKSSPLSKPPLLDTNLIPSKVTSKPKSNSNPNDFQHVRLGGLPFPTYEWYEQYSDTHSKARPFSRCSISDFYRGFKMTISLYKQVDNRIAELVHPNSGEKYNESLVYDVIWREYTFLQDSTLPKWWARDAMSVWIRMTALWVEQERREREAGQVIDLRDFENASKRFKSEVLVPVRHAFFIISIRSGKELRKVIVPFGDFLPDGEEDGVAGTRFKDLKVKTLWGLLREREGVDVDQRRDKLVVKKRVEKGSVIDIHLSSNFDLHTGVVWKAFGGSAIYLEIIKSDV